jgi:glycosyltransferase involved in cell wall biosynthesis
MKIAMLTPVVPPYKSGMTTAVVEYAARLRERGHQVDVIGPTLKVMNAGFFLPLARLKQYDVVHLHYPYYGTAELTAIARRIGFVKRLVITFHMDAVAPGFKGMIFNVHRTLIQPLVLKAADAILVSSLDYAQSSSLRRRHNLPLVELPFGIDAERFHPAAEGERTDQAPRLLFVGGLDSAHIFKGLPVLLQALPLLKNPWRLTVVGDGNLRASFEATAQSLGCRHCVEFVGSVSHEALPGYYRSADIHLFPSTSRAEAFGLVALEAAASGIPTIASDLPGVRTVVKDEETGLLVPPGDVQALAEAIDRLLNDRPLREKLGQSARNRALSAYAWERLIPTLEQTYENRHHH